MATVASRTRSNLLLALSIVTVGVATYDFVKRRPAVEPHSDDSGVVETFGHVSIDESESIGDPRARVVLVEFADFQCPYCGVFARTVLPDLEREFVDGGRVLIAFRNMPLSRHKDARAAAAAAECAARQKRFGEMYDSLFGDQKHLSEVWLIDRARRMGLQETAFKACLTDGARAAIDEDSADANALGLNATPTFYVGTRKDANDVVFQRQLTGSVSTQGFRSVLNAVIATSSHIGPGA